MGNVKPIDKVTEYLEDVLARHPEVVLLAFRKDGMWTTAQARTLDEKPYYEILGILEVFKSHVMDEYYNDTEIGPHKTIVRGEADDGAEEGEQ